MQLIDSFRQKFLKLIPFWFFLTLFKLAAGLHYTMMAPLGAQVFPIWLVGVLIGVAAFIQLCFDVPAGYLTDRFGYRTMLIVTTLFFLAAGTCFLFGLTKSVFLCSLACSIFGWQFFTPGTTAYTISQSEEKYIGRLISVKEVFASMGIVIASALVVFAVSWSVRVLGVVLVLIFILAFIAIICAPKEDGYKRERVPVHKRGKKHLLFWKEAWQSAHALKPVSYLLMVSSFTGSLFYAIIWFVVPLLIATQVHNGTLGLGLGVFDFSVVVLGFFLGKVVDSFNKKILVLMGIIVFAVAGILLGSNFGFLFLLLGFIATSGDELTGLSLWAWLYTIDSHQEHYGLITGMIVIWDDLGWTTGPILGGVLYTFVGPSWSIAIGGVCVLINLAVYITLVKHPMPNLFKEFSPYHERKIRHKH